MLSCIKIGAIHGFYHYSYSSDSLADRIDSCKPALIITTDYSLSGDETYIKAKVDDALNKSNHQPKHVVVVERIPKKII